MNMKSLTVVFGAISAFALGACTVNGTGSTSTGAGGGSGTTTTAAAGTGGEAAGVGGSGGGSTTAGTGGAAACMMGYSCAEAIDPMKGDPKLLCEGPSAMLYDALQACTCTGACKAACGASACANAPASAECTTCLQDPTTGCKKEFDACSSDAG
jgi:hypothetical protein